MNRNLVIALVAGMIVFMVARKAKAGTVADNAGLQSLIDAAANKAAVDPALVRAIIQVESVGDVNAFNPEDGSRDAYQPGTAHDTTGSFGLMQVRGKTAKDLKKSYPWLPVLTAPVGKTLLVPATNLAYGTALIAELQRNLKTSDIRAIAVAYNGGQKAGKTYLLTGSAANVAYADKVEAHYG